MKPLPAMTLSAALIAMPLLSACVSVIPEQRAPEAVYQIGFAGEERAEAELSGVIVVREPDGPRLLAGRQITAEGTDGGLVVLGEAQWADNATLMLKFALIDRLNAYVGDGVAVDNASGARGDVEVHWRLQTFGLTDTAAETMMTLSILDGRTRAPLAQKRLSARVDGSDVASLIAASEETIAAAAEFVRGFMAGYMTEELERVENDES